MTILPDIVVVVGDHHRWDALGLAGNNFVSTPHLDRLGQSGSWFSEAVTVFPTRDLAVRALVSGAYPADLPASASDFAASELGARLTSLGYWVAEIRGNNSLQETTSEAVALLARPAEMPRAVLVTLPAIWTFDDIDPICFAPYRGTGVPLATSYASVTAYDAAIGRIVGTIEEQGKREATIFVYASASGDQFKARDLVSQANTCHSEVVRIPLILSWPGQLPAGTVSDALVGLHDIAPTLASLVGVELAGAQGASMLPLLGQGALPVSWRETIYLQNKQRRHVSVVCDEHKNFRFDVFPPWAQRAIWDGRYKLILSADGGKCSLYDHAIDPEEEYDLYNLPGNDPMGALDHFESRSKTIFRVAGQLEDAAAALGDLMGVKLARGARTQHHRMVE